MMVLTVRVVKDLAHFHQFVVTVTGQRSLLFVLQAGDALGLDARLKRTAFAELAALARETFVKVLPVLR